MSHQVTSEHIFVIRAFLRRNRFFRDEAVRIWGSFEDATQELWLHCARVCHGWPNGYKTSSLVWKACEYRIRHQRRIQHASRIPKPCGEFFWLASPAMHSEMETQDSLKVALSLVTPREAEVLRKRHIDGLTMEAVGRDMGVISSRIDQIERQAIKKIRGAA